MLDAFWSGVGEELARHWASRVLTPAFAFWAGGLALLWWRPHAADVRDRGWLAEITTSADLVSSWPLVIHIGLIVGGLLVVATSALLAERLTLPVLRLLEGYWQPGWLTTPFVRYRQWRQRAALQRRLALARIRNIGRITTAEWKELQAHPPTDPAGRDRRRGIEERAAQKTLTPREATQLSRVTSLLATTPDTSLVMPTRLGDILRAAERRPNYRYGLDGVTCWPALWLTAPAETRTELAQARAGLDTAARSWLWGALFLAWTPINPWAAAVGIGAPLLIYRYGVIPRGITFGTLLGTAYDLHRMNLYTALHLPRPESPEDERGSAGPRITQSLSSRLEDPLVRYRFDPPPAGGGRPMSG
jgi:hypothetical protein